MPYLSVVIPAANEAKFVGRAIEALRRQDLPRRDFEIIVVDNNSTDGTAEIAAQAGADLVVHESEQGTNFARERGFRASNGKIVAFLDADCEPPPSWLRHVSRTLSVDGVAATSGPYDYGFKGLLKLGDYLYTRLLFANADRLFWLFLRKRFGVILGGNFAVRRETLERAGGFPPIPFFGDEAGVARRITDAGGRERYDPHLVIRSSPRRFTDKGLFRTVVRYAYHDLRTFFSKKTP